MKDVLAEIVANKYTEVAEQKKLIPLEFLQEKVKGLPATRSMKKALLASQSGIIAEFKRRSPSKGWIKEEANALEIPLSYSLNGASALSILTDEKYFGGTMDDIIAARPLVDIPIIRKEFIVDKYQLYQARLIGADAVLLIAAALTVEECHSLIETSHELGLEVLLELHGEDELPYINSSVDMVGINNRNLGTFHTDVANSYKMAKLLPQNMVKVSESGISNPDTVSQLRKEGFRGFLIGENFMKCDNPGGELREFIANIE